MNEFLSSLDRLDWGHSVLYLGVAVVVVFLSLLVWLRGRSKKKNSPTTQPVGLISEGVLEPSAGDHGGDTKTSLETFKKRPFRDEQTITKHIEIAEFAGDQEALARLYLERACLDVSNGAHDAAGDLLRKSILLATSHNIKDIHAAARLELAEIAEADGDMTTACEHWQMARTLFHELDAQDDIKRTDARMLSNGCPTDWVLTDF